jgi:hypothetical protein
VASSQEAVSRLKLEMENLADELEASQGRQSHFHAPPPVCFVWRITNELSRVHENENSDFTAGG